MQTFSSKFHIWDIPGPPPLEQSLLDENDLPSLCQLGTIHTSNCTGITFFIASDSTYAVHAHTSSEPSAYSTFTNLTPGRQDSVAWVYVPIQSDVMQFGFSHISKLPGHFARIQGFLVRGAGRVFSGAVKQ